jgi:hypothetical protein
MTRGAALPIVVTAMPDPRSISRLPSTSSTMPPPARAHAARDRRGLAVDQGRRLRAREGGGQVAALFEGAHVMSVAVEASPASGKVRLVAGFLLIALFRPGNGT